VREEWKTEYAGGKGVRIVEKMTTNYTKWLTNTTNLIKSGTKRCIENGLRRIMEGIKKIRKIMKGNGGRIPEKGKEYWEKYEELEKE
jgi:hypothetical protein